MNCSLLLTRKMKGVVCIRLHHHRKDILLTSRTFTVQVKLLRQFLFVSIKLNKTIFFLFFFSGRRLVLCENDMGKVIACGLFRRIRLHWVHYGYIAGDSACGITCTNTCSSQKAFRVLRRWCEGKSFCVVKPWNVFFRAPCGNRKYLKLYYSC